MLGCPCAPPVTISKLNILKWRFMHAWKSLESKIPTELRVKCAMVQEASTLKEAEINKRFYVEQGKVSPEITFDKVFLENEKVAAKRQKVSAKRHKEEHIKKNKEEELCSFLKEWNEQQPSPLREFVPENIVRKHGAERVAGLLEEYGQRDKGFSSFLKALVS